MFALKIKAFTLAEVLITLLIVGVIGSITIPALINDLQDSNFKSVWKKEFAVLSQAFISYRSDNGGNLVGLCPASWDENCFPAQFKQYLSIAKECPGAQTRNNCWGSTRGTTLDTKVEIAASTPLEDMFTHYCPGYILSDGSFLIMETWSRTDPNHLARMFIDVNGVKSPNTWGKDLFAVVVTQNGIKPYGTSCSEQNGIGCSGEYLK